MVTKRDEVTDITANPSTQPHKKDSIIFVTGGVLWPFRFHVLGNP